MVIFINGLSIATLELKNPWTNQTVFHARKQYQTDRDPQEPLFQFARCLVHFAVDTDEVFMTTRLDSKKTYFLPFNKGHNNGKGNPPNPNGYKTAYLWEDILQPQSLTRIIEHFAKLVKKQDRDSGKTTQTLYFPRYHQLEVVRKILHHAHLYGVGHTYLIQHSAGSGKSNSITWTAYQLIELYASGSDHPIFDSVVVVTDRRILDRQIRDNIRQFSEIKTLSLMPKTPEDSKKRWKQEKKSSLQPFKSSPISQMA